MGVPSDKYARFWKAAMQPRSLWTKSIAPAAGFKPHRKAALPVRAVCNTVVQISVAPTPTRSLAVIGDEP
jgi:hypothetical protein